MTIRRRLNVVGNRNFLLFQDGFPAQIPCKPQDDLLNSQSLRATGERYGLTNVAEL